MTNAEKFKMIFGLYATELWAKTEKDFLEWLNAEAPSVQINRDIPVKPNETVDRTWGIPKRQAVCPNCDYYLGDVYFFGDGKKVTYCEHCGQAIDWEGWCND